MRTEDDRLPGAGTTSRGSRAGRAAIALAAAAALGACASTAAALRGEREIDSCARWMRAADAVPSRVTRVATAAAGAAALRIEVEERGRGDRDRVLVLVHGVLSDRRMWRYVTGRLGAEHDLLLVDLPGCGGSDRPSPEAFGPRGYEPDAIAPVLFAAVRDRLRDRPAATRVTLVAHSLGAAVVLRGLGDPGLRAANSDVIRRVDGAVLFSPLDWAYAKRDPVWERVVGLSTFEVAVGNALGLLRERIAVALREDTANPEDLPREEVDRLWDVLSDRGTRTAGQSMIRRAVPFTRDLRPDWARIDAYEADLARVDVPCLVVCGGRDTAVPEALGYKVRQQLPDARLRVVNASGHCVPVDHPDESADLVLQFVASRGAGWVAYAEHEPGTDAAGVRLAHAAAAAAGGTGALR